MGGQDKSRSPGPELLIVLVSAVGAGPFLIYGLSASSKSVIAELRIDETQFGLLATACFSCAAVGNLTLGRFADRRSDVVLTGLIFLASTLSLVLAGIPAGYSLLLLAAGCAGLSQSFSNGVTNRVLIDRVSFPKRMGWMGVKQSGAQVGQMVASLFFPMTAGVMGWRGATLLAAGIPLLLVLVSVRILRRVPRLPDVGPPSISSAPGVSDRTGGLSDNHGRIVFALAVFGFCNGIGMHATDVYLPLFAVRELEFSLVLGGVTAAVAGVVGVVARVSLGWVLYLGAPSPVMLLILAVGAVAAGGLFLGSSLTGWSSFLWCAVVLHGLTVAGIAVVLMSALLRAVPSTSIGSASGLVSAGMSAGNAVGPLFMGLLVGSDGGFVAGWSAITVIYVGSVVVASLIMRMYKQPESDA